MSQSRCKTCGAPIVFIESAKTGKPIPCNEISVLVVTETGDVVRGRTSHFSTCPQAEQHRKERP